MVDLWYLEENARKVTSPNPEPMEADTTPKITRASLEKASPLRPTTTKEIMENRTTAKTRILRERGGGEGGRKGGRKGGGREV